MALLRNINFAADNGMDAFLIGFVVKLNSAKQVSVIRHRDGGHFLLFDDAHQLLDIAGAIEKRIVSVAMKVNERTFGHEDLYLV